MRYAQDCGSSLRAGAALIEADGVLAVMIQEILLKLPVARSIVFSKWDVEIGVLAYDCVNYRPG